MKDNSAGAEAPQERTPEQAAAAAPVSLPAGSFDAAALARDIDAASKSKDRPEAVDQAIAKHNALATDFSEQGLQPGYKRIAVEVEGLGITENRIVFDAPEQPVTAAQPAPSKGE